MLVRTTIPRRARRAGSRTATGPLIERAWSPLLQVLLEPVGQQPEHVFARVAARDRVRLVRIDPHVELLVGALQALDNPDAVLEMHVVVARPVHQQETAS